MPKRLSCAGLVYHVLNRAAKRAELFSSSSDYQDLEAVIVEAKQRTGMRLLTYCIMPNHWHLVVWPTTDTQLPQFMHWLTLTHAQRWHSVHGTSGTGAVYQGRYKALPVQTDRHFLILCRYVEANALRAGLVRRAEHWQWSALWRRKNCNDILLDAWPVSRPEDWEALVNHEEKRPETEFLRSAIKKGRPLGEASWADETARRLGLEPTLRRRGRPKKTPDLF
jgi:putative transposase